MLLNIILAILCCSIYTAAQQPCELDLSYGYFEDTTADVLQFKIDERKQVLTDLSKCSTLSIKLYYNPLKAEPLTVFTNALQKVSLTQKINIEQLHFLESYTGLTDAAAKSLIDSLTKILPTFYPNVIFNLELQGNQISTTQGQIIFDTLLQYRRRENAGDKKQNRLQLDSVTTKLAGYDIIRSLDSPDKYSDPGCILAYFRLDKNMKFSSLTFTGIQQKAQALSDKYDECYKIIVTY